MYMKVFPHGQGNGDQPTRYLVRPDYPGRREAPPEILRGDPDVTRDLIDSIERKWKFTAGVLSWHPDDTVTPKQEECVMDDFESVAFAGLEPDQRNILWVRHRHAGHHELHFVIPRLDLASGKDFNACPPGWQKDFDVFRDLHNHREGWARPDDPARARLHTPEHADLHKARLIRWGKTPGKDERAEAKEAVHAYLTAKIEQGLVRSREDVVAALKEAGLEINRTGKEYLTVKDPESEEKLRLKGGIYGEQWNFTALPDRSHQGEDRAGRQGDRESDLETVRQFEQELGRILAKRAQYNRKRYPQQHVQLGERDHLTLPDYEHGFRQDLFAGHDPGFHHSADSWPERLGPALSFSLSSHELAAGSGRTSEAERNSGSAERPDLEHLQGIGAVSDGRQELSAGSAQVHLQSRRDGRRTGSLEHSEEMSHDRTGKDAQGHLGPHGTRSDRHSGKSRNEAHHPAEQAGNAGPSHTGTTAKPQSAPDRAAGIRTALATLERYTRELGTALVALEHLVERRIEQARERQRNKGLRLGR
jgi:hypothetical protein